MKSLKNFIFEKLETYQLIDLEVSYNVIPENNKDYIIFKVPEIYSEDDFLIYIQDKYLEDLPGSETNSKNIFGKNYSNIFDVLFEYDKYIKKGETSEDYIDFDTNYDDKVKNDENNKFVYVKLINLKYIIKFDKFEINSETQDNIKEDLITIFKNSESNDKNEWSLNIKLDEENIKYQ